MMIGIIIRKQFNIPTGGNALDYIYFNFFFSELLRNIKC